MEERCENCRFVLMRPAESPTCRRYPPIANAEAQVSMGWWCGEFKPKADPAYVHEVPSVRSGS